MFQEEKVSKAYIRLAFPVVFSMAVSLVYNLADTFFVAQTNDTNIVAGVSLSMPLFTTVMAVGNIFAQGGSSLISRLLGKRDGEGVKRVSSFCFYTALLIGVLMGILMLVFRVPLLYLLGADEDTFATPRTTSFTLPLARLSSCFRSSIPTCCGQRGCRRNL